LYIKEDYFVVVKKGIRKYYQLTGKSLAGGEGGRVSNTVPI
jgi:hypothetical protein